MENGRCFVSNNYRGDAKGFRFFAQRGNQKFQMGDTVQIDDKIKLKVILPNKTAVIKLINRGKVISSIESTEGDFIVTKPGQYRVEVLIDGKAWIFSNHIRIEI